MLLKRYKQVCIYISFWLLVSACAVSCKNDMEKIRMDMGDNPPSAITKNFISLYSDSGKVLLRMEAPLRKDYAGEEFYSEMPEGIKVTFYGDSMKVMARLKANYAFIKGPYMLITGKVDMDNEKSGRLTTESLLWNSDEQTVTTNDYIEIRQKNRMLWGQGLRAKQDFSEYTIDVPGGSVTLKDE